jgi:hypothetical protein
MQNPQIGAEISRARILRLQEEARSDGRVRLARHHRRAFRPAGAWRQAVGMRLVGAGVRMLSQSAETRRGMEVR